jgi:hypothetical protein
VIKWVKRLIGKKDREVILIRFNNEAKIVKAHKSDAGWIANWWEDNKSWSILLPEGKTAGYDLVTRWLPHSGWDGTEFDSSVFRIE